MCVLLTDLLGLLSNSGGRAWAGWSTLECGVEEGWTSSTCAAELGSSTTVFTAGLGSSTIILTATNEQASIKHGDKGLYCTRFPRVDSIQISNDCDTWKHCQFEFTYWRTFYRVGNESRM